MVMRPDLVPQGVLVEINLLWPSFPLALSTVRVTYPSPAELSSHSGL
jgi:hypothetical protein